MTDPRTAEIRAAFDRDALIDGIADALNAHPMLLGYGESDRLLISGALAIAAVKAIPLDDLAYLLGRIEALEKERADYDARNLADLIDRDRYRAVVAKVRQVVEQPGSITIDRAYLRAALDALADGAPEQITDHAFLPVAGHPDDDECTHRADGTDATYCGEPRDAHLDGDR